MNALQIFLLGAPRFEQGGRNTAIRSQVEAALLAVLVLEGGPLARNRLAGLLWPALPQPKASNNLRVTLSRLRSRLEAEAPLAAGCLLTDRLHVQWVSSADAAVDVTELSALLAQTAQHPHPSRATCPTCREQLSRAVALYQGELLEGIHVDHSPESEQWLLFQRERLRLEVWGALQDLADGDEQQGRYGQTERWARRSLALDPLDEAAHRRLIRALAAQGERSAALVQVETCRQLLADELGMALAQETEALAGAIRAGQWAPPAAGLRPFDAAVLAGDNPHPPPHNLPAPTAPFFGRERELAHLDAWLAQPATRLITIAAPGGMGKTRLALAAAAQQLAASGRPPAARRFPQGVYLASLAAAPAGPASAELVCQVILEALGASIAAASPRPLLEDLIDSLKPRRILLLLDNIEPHLEASREEVQALLQRLLEAAPGVHLLLTSRQRVELPGEQVLPLAGFELSTEPPEALLAHPAGLLFLHAARRIVPDYEVAPAALPDLARILRLVMGMPLGIELAAAWVDGMGLDEIAEEISRDLAFLEATESSVPARQHSLLAIFDHTWTRLQPDEQWLFSRLSVFHSRFSFHAAQEIAGADRRTLLALVRKSLVQFDREAKRYGLHNLLRQFAARRWEERTGHGDDLPGRLSAYYCAWLAPQAAALTGPQQLAAMHAIADAQEDLRRAWEWACQAGQWRWLAQAVDGLHRFYIWQANYRTGQQAIAQAIAAVEPVAGHEPQRLLAHLRIWLASYHNIAGQTAAAAAELDRAARLLAALERAGLDLRAERAFFLRERGITWRKSDLEASLVAYQESEALYRALGDSWSMALTQAWLQDVVMRSGDLHEAHRLGQERLALHQRLGDDRGAAHAMLHLAWLELRNGQRESAQRRASSAAALAQQMHDSLMLSTALAVLGRVHLYAGQFAEAERLLAESLALGEQTAHYITVKDGLIFLGVAAMEQQRFEAAEGYFQRMLLLSRELGYSANESEGYRFLGLARYYAGRWQAAGQALEDGLALARASGYGYGIANGQLALGLVAMHAGDWETARSHAAPVAGLRGAAQLTLGLLALDAREVAQGADLLLDMVATAREQGDKRWHHDLLKALAVASVAAARIGRPDLARVYLAEALPVARHKQAFVPLAYATAAQALLAQQAEDQSQAAAALAALRAVPFAAHSTWFTHLLPEL